MGEKWFKEIQRRGRGRHTCLPNDMIFWVKTTMVVPLQRQHWSYNSKINYSQGQGIHWQWKSHYLQESLLIFENNVKQAAIYYVIYVHHLQRNTMQKIRPTEVFPCHVSFSWGIQKLTTEMDMYVEILFLLSTQKAWLHCRTVVTHCKLSSILIFLWKPFHKNSPQTDWINHLKFSYRTWQFSLRKKHKPFWNDDVK